MKNAPIDIQIENKKLYTLIAFLVDRNDFIKDIDYIRKALNITSIPYTFPKFPYQEANNVTNYYHKGMITIYDVSQCFKDISSKEQCKFYYLDSTLTSAIMFAEGTIKKFNKNRMYLPVVLSSVLTGCVKNNDLLMTTRILRIDKNEAQNLIDEFEDNEEIMSIQVNRESSFAEVKATFGSIKRLYFGTEKIVDKSELAIAHLFNIPTDKLADTISNIERDRFWYWQHINHVSYQKIWELPNKWRKVHDKEGVIKAIHQYRNKLQLGMETYK